MRVILTFLVVFIQAACVPSWQGISQDLPLPTDPASREQEENARTLLQEGSAAMGTHDWPLAEMRYTDALTIRKNLFGKNNLYVNEAKLRLTSALLAQGDFNRALPLLEQIRNSILQSKDGDPVVRSEIAFDTAMLYRRIGHDIYSEDLLNESLKIRKQWLGLGHIDTQISEFWISNHCGSREDSSFDDDKINIFIKNITRSLDRENNHSLFVARHQQVSFCAWMRAHYIMANRLIKQKNLIKLDKLLESGDNAALRWFANCEPLADYYEMQGVIYASIGNTDKAWRNYHSAIAQIIRIFGISDPSARLILTDERQRMRRGQIRLVSLYQGLAHVKVLEGNLSESEQILQEAAGFVINGRTDLELAEHEREQLFRLIVDLAEIRWLQRKYQLANRTWLHALGIFEKRFRKLAVDQTESGLLTELESLRQMSRSVYSLLYTAPAGIEKQNLLKVALATSLLMQGRATDELASQLAPFNTSAPKKEKEMSRKLVSLRMRYAALEYRPPDYTQEGKYAQDKRALLSEEATLEQSMRLLGMSESEKTNTPMTREIISQVQLRLPSEGVLVQYLLYKPYFPSIPTQKQTEKHRYLALLLHADGQSDAVDLGEADVIEERVLRLYNELTSSSISYNDANSRKLYDLIIRPLLPSTRRMKFVYIVPDGQLHLIPFSVLQGDQGLFGTTNQIFYLSSGRDLLRKSAKAPATEVVVFANPDLDAIPDGPANSIAEIFDSPYERTRVMNLRRTQRGLEFHGLGPLKYAEKEADDIGKIFPQTKAYLLGEASEQRLTNLTSAPGILHLATHGAFLVNGTSDSKFTSRGFLAREYDAPPANPLLRSMLLLAGARKGRLSEDSVYDGLATALELSSLPLQGTQMVVLSACESGLGEVAPGEGVAGLRRAFLVAGAETVVASLWKVDDAVTRELMRFFYSYLRLGEGRVEAMQHASQEIRAEHPHPYYWASFIVIGQGGPLRGMVN